MAGERPAEKALVEQHRFEAWGFQRNKARPQGGKDVPRPPTRKREDAAAWTLRFVSQADVSKWVTFRRLSFGAADTSCRDQIEIRSTSSRLISSRRRS
jgi:hypothetical protein